jgi:hypothetical protein
MRGKGILAVDAAVNLLLGAFLLVFPLNWVSALGIPATDHSFYPSVLGAVLAGIGGALLLELFRRGPMVGLGLGGAVCINLTAGIVLAAWLVAGGLELPLKGKLILWGLVVLLAGISILELFSGKVKDPGAREPAGPMNSV